MAMSLSLSLAAFLRAIGYNGNLIGQVEVIGVVGESFTFCESYANVPNGHDSYIQGRIVDPATGEAEFVRVDGNPQVGWDRTVQYVHDFVKYTVADNGEYEVINLNLVIGSNGTTHAAP